MSGWWKTNMLLTCVMLWRRTELSRWWSATAQSSRYWCLITRVANAFILVTALSDDFAVHSVMLFSDCGSFLWCESVHYTYIWYICTLYIHTHTHTHFMILCPGLPGWAGARKVKPMIWILVKQETVSGSGISWAMQVCTSLQTDNNASTPPLSFLQARCPSCRPTNSVKALKGCTYIHTNLYSGRNR